MAKRRTRKEKAKTREKRITSNWSSGSNTFKFEPNVNSQNIPSENRVPVKPDASTKSQNSAIMLDSGAIRKNIYKSLILAVLILGTELMIYLIWK